MKKITQTLLLCSSLTLALTACSPEQKTKEITKVTVNSQMDSISLADAGEQLVAPHTIHLADRAFEMALEKDPTNGKAKFYRALLARFMVFEGILTRIQPYVKNHGTPEQLAELEQAAKKIPNSPLKNFLLNPASGATPISNLSDLQTFLAEYRDSLQKLRKFVSQNQDIKLNLFVNPLIMSSVISENMQNACQVVSETEFTCDNSEAATVKVNIADLLVLKQMAAGEILYHTIYTSYNVGKIDSFIKENENKELAPEAAIKALSEVEGFGELRKDQSLTSIRELGSDLGVAVKWALQYQKEICPRAKDGSLMARKNHLFSQGFCIEDASLVQKNLALLGAAMQGPIAVNIGEDSVRPVSKNLNIFAPLDKPVKNILSLAPATWNQQGMATSFKDKTLGGLFPDGDADDLLINSAK